MKLSSQPPRTPLKLSASVHHQLDMYALAASAAGVGMLALASAAEAKVVYTPATMAVCSNCGPVALDLNHDGATDFQLALYHEYFSSGVAPLLGPHSHNPFMITAPRHSNQAWAVKTNWSFLCAAALPKGQVVGLTPLFSPDSQASSGCMGNLTVAGVPGPTVPGETESKPTSD